MVAEPTPQPRTPSTPAWIILAAVLVVIGAVVAFVLLRPAQAPINTNVSPNANTAPNANSVNNVNTPPPAAEYRNPTYGYTIRYPASWRVAEDYMAAYAAVRHPASASLVDDYVVFTTITPAEEADFVSYAGSNPGIATRPWLDFAIGTSVVIQPSTLTRDDYITAVPPGTDTVTVVPSSVRDVTLSSGRTITRLTRSVSDDNGSFTYDVALIPTSMTGVTYFEMRIESSRNDYEAGVFATMIEAFTAP